MRRKSGKGVSKRNDVDSMELPVRLLDEFSIVSTRNADVYVPLENITADNIAEVYVLGKLVPHDETETSSKDSPSGLAHCYGDD